MENEALDQDVHDIHYSYAEKHHTYTIKQSLRSLHHKLAYITFIHKIYNMHSLRESYVTEYTIIIDAEIST
jgi:hypothetical protein